MHHRRRLIPSRLERREISRFVSEVGNVNGLLCSRDTVEGAVRWRMKIRVAPNRFNKCGWHVVKRDVSKRTFIV